MPRLRRYKFLKHHVMEKQLEPHQQRVMEESNELARKINKLNSFIERNPAFHQLPNMEQRLLRSQLDAMIKYNGILSTRIILF